MNLVKFNMLKEQITNSIVPLLDELRNEKTKSIQHICESFVVTTNDGIECVKSAFNEICSSNPDIRGRIDVFDKLEFNIVNDLSVKGVTLLLFLEKDKYRFDHPDINRFYQDYPEFFTGIFEERDDDESNKFIGRLFGVITLIKEKIAHFGTIKTKSIDGICIDFIPDVIGKVNREGLKCKAIEQKISDDTENVYFFIYEIECEAMNKQIETLERRSSIRLVK